ncbi:hypothetical protein [Pseudoalteromonas phenolica]|uniref:hypothetical protein n=1 Tax=Pseudoalteromonas phenolica TaxID=161398 RepID=UPI00110B1105|nr:hypothetical protein [Pseudoalteromonas phenolica]TMO52550.1 hypothetical protein CWC21_21645 [Pseudoalteromonas phenolica]
MLIFITPKAQDYNAIKQPDKEIIRKTEIKWNPIKTPVLVAWYEIWSEPMDFAKDVLIVAENDVVCRALLNMASEKSQIDHCIDDGAFKEKDLQDKYLSMLRNWLSPLSGNVTKKAYTAHAADFATQYEEVWLNPPFSFDEKTMAQVADLAFFKGQRNNGRRDRAQIYRNITEVARALVGEMTCWAARKAEKVLAYRLLRSPGLANCQRLMLAELVKKNVKLKTSMWEYLPYFLYGVAGDRNKSAPHAELVWGAIYDVLKDDESTGGLADDEIWLAFKSSADMYRRWRELPRVVRYQTLISDIARMTNVAKIDSAHCRVQFPSALFEFENFSPKPQVWDKKEAYVVEHKLPNPHDPGKEFPFAYNWTRNEFCPNVITARLLMAPLYAGTSGHTQGRILGWIQFLKTIESDLASKIPIHLIIPAGYFALWRLYYDKRVSGFHTPFETLQGAYVAQIQMQDTQVNPIDKTWTEIVHVLGGQLRLDELWRGWMDELCPKGTARIAKLEQLLVEERAAVMNNEPGVSIPRWSGEMNPATTGTDVNPWSDNMLNRASDSASLKILLEGMKHSEPLTEEDFETMAFELEQARNVPLPDDEEFV